MPAKKGGICMGVLRSRDFWSGAAFVAIGLWFLWRGQDYRFGSAAAMGPGYFPVLIALALALVGLVVLLKALRAHGAAIERPVLRPLVFVLAAIVVFALSIERFGLVPATIAAIVVASPASRAFRWGETVALAIGMAGFGALVFVYALSQNMPLVRF